MKLTPLVFCLSFLGTAVSAQSMLLGPSPIPDNAETRFCYYEGLIYSENSYIVLTGSNTVTDTTRSVEERLLRCYRNKEGNMTWKPESTMQMGR